MPLQSEAPRPHGDPLEKEVVKPNKAQRQSDAPAGAARGNPPEGLAETDDHPAGRDSTANGIPAADEAAGDVRRKHYEGSAELVSKID